MKGARNSPRKLKQSKISNFWSNAPSTGCQAVGERKKRKSDQEACTINEKPAKKISAESEEWPKGSDEPGKILGRNGKETETGSGSSVKPDLRIVEEDYFADDFPFEDFENNPFLSSNKEKSPKKNVLAENLSQSPSSLETEKNLFFQSSEKYELTFDIPVRCKILRFAVVTSGKFEQVLVVEDEKSEKRGICKLRDAWIFSSVSANDSVVVRAYLKEDGWIVDNKTGYLVLHPDSIVSSTTLVNSMYCLRKGFISNFYKGIEPGSNRFMLVGRLIHEFFDKCLKLTSGSGEDEFSAIVSDLLRSKENIRDIYFAGMNSAEARREIECFVPRMKNFLDVYVWKKIEPSGKNFAGSIEEILDIEELIKSPNLGLQGRIDATVKIKSKNDVKIAPVELKTGSSAFSAQYRTQLTIYCLLMNEIGRRVESGLLLYLKEGTMEEIEPNRDDIRNLFLLRNRFVGYCRGDALNEWPEPIHSVSGCNKCPYLRICTTHLKSEDLYEMHPIRNVQIPDIEPSHADYFIKWNRLLWLEFGEAAGRQAKFDMDKLTLKSKIVQFGSCFLHEFTAGSDAVAAEKEKPKKAFQQGMNVNVKDEEGRMLCVGKLFAFTNVSLSLMLDKKLTDFSNSYKMEFFKFNFLNLHMGSLGTLLDERFRNLREIIIDKRKPTFQDKLEKKSFVEKCLKKLLPLNREQQNAVLKSLLSNDYLLIKGPPGTGKTQTIAALVRVLLAMDKTVLVAGHTHTSVDNILMRLDEIDFLRLGSLKSINEKLHGKSYAKLMEDTSTVEDVEKLFDRKLIAATCMGLDVDLMWKKKFDVCIVDESSQALQTEILRPLYACRKFILVGDENQLPPIVKNPEASTSGMNVSMFEWLLNDSAAVNLKFQYRMNSCINSLANSIAYGGSIECGSEEVAKATIAIKNVDLFRRSDAWIREILSASIGQSVWFVDTSEYFLWKRISGPENRRSSRVEANIISKLLASLIEFGFDEGSIGVITSFVDQIVLLRKKFSAGNLEKIELNTVDQYQGRDKEIILFSCGKENQPETDATEAELLGDAKRLTVAVTRAKCKLIFVGDRTTMAKYGPFRKLFDSLTESNFFRLTDGQNDFFWTNFED